VTSSTNAVGGEAVTYSYDAAGIRLTTADSTTSPNDRSYAYARLVCTKLAATSCTSGTRVLLSLDGFSRTHDRTTSGTTTTWRYRGTAEDVVASTASGTTTTYARSTGAPSGEKIGSATPTWYLSDVRRGDPGVTQSGDTNSLPSALMEVLSVCLIVFAMLVGRAFASRYTDAAWQLMGLGSLIGGSVGGYMGLRTKLTPTGVPAAPHQRGKLAIGSLAGFAALGVFGARVPALGAFIVGVAGSWLVAVLVSVMVRSARRRRRDDNAST